MVQDQTSWQQPCQEETVREHDANNNDKPLILVADDEMAIRDLIREILIQEGFRVLEAKDGPEVLERVREHVPDLLLLDISMPGMNGLEVLTHLRRAPETRLMPVIVLSAMSQEKVHALRLGANDFLDKPMDPSELLARVGAHLRVQQAMRDLEDIEAVLVFLATMVEAKDAYTEQHVERVAAVAVHIGRALDLPEKALRDLRRGAQIHDIGKLGISEAILKKPGPLTDAEFEEMKRHTLIGEELCRPLRTLRNALPIIRNHHERWDGTGYPDGLAGEDIPLLARIVTIADVVDAITSTRHYRSALPLEYALAVIREGAGQQFDPKLARLFLELVEQGKIPVLTSLQSS